MPFWSRPAVGLDIGSRVVKAVQLKKAGKGIELEKFGIADIYPSGEKPAAADAQRRSIVEAIKQAMSDAGITADQVVTAVAGESIIVRYIQLPDMPEEELKNALRWEAEEYIPFRVEDVNIDSSIIGRTGEGSNARLDVLLVCARKDLIEDQIQLLSEAGLSAATIDVDSFAFLNCFDVNYKPEGSEVAGLINVGGDITSISVYSGGAPRFSRDISIGGSSITGAIQQRLDISLAEAEALKLKVGAPKPAGGQAGMQDDSTVGGSSPSNDLANTIRSTVEAMTGDEGGGDASSPEAVAERTIRNTLGNLIGEIRRSVQFFENQSRGHKLQRLVLGGGSVGLKGLAEYIQAETRLPVEIIDPLKRIPVTGKGVDAELLKEYRNMLGVGVGLALRKVMD